jgi:hypothetical protein
MVPDEPQRPLGTSRVHRQGRTVGWDERGSFGFEVVRRTARDMSAAEHFWSDYAVVPLPDACGQAKPHPGSR